MSRPVSKDHQPVREREAPLSPLTSKVLQPTVRPEPDGVTDIVANRIAIEQAKGMLMLIYGIEADEAFALLTWRARTNDVGLRQLATQLLEEFAGIARNYRGLSAACDRVLLTAHERVKAGLRNSTN